MPNNEMDYSLIHRTPDGNGKILVTTPGSPDKGSWESEAELKTYVNQDVNTAINAINTRVTNIEETLMGENEVTVQYPSDSTYTSLMPNRVPARALKFAEVPRFRGKTRAWNQLVPVPTSATETANNVTFTNNTDGTITITTNGTATANTAYICYIGSWRDGLSFVGGHKYLFSGSGLSSVRVEYIASPVGSGSNTVFYIDNFSDSSIATATGNGSWLYLEIRVSNGSTVNTTIIPQIYDLTAIFGAGNEPSTVADALAQIPALGEYNAYDAGSLVDTEVSAVKSVGVNIWDEEWELGDFDSQGQPIQNSTHIRCKNFIKVEPNTTYYLKTANKPMYLYWYDINKNFIAMDGGGKTDTTFTTSADAQYIKLNMGSAYGTTYNHDIQICLNSYADKTTYHPYKTDTLSLPETVTLRSAGSVADELDVESGEITRKVGVVDLSTLTWSNYDANGHITNGLQSLIKPSATDATIGNIVHSTYEVIASSSSLSVESTKKTIAVNSAGTLIYTDGGSSETSPTGYLYYELATPTTESIDPVPYNFLEVEGGGTVETIQTQTPVIDNCLDVTYDIIPQ